MLQSSSVTLLRNDRKSRQQTLGCHRPVIQAVSYYYLVTKPCFGEKYVILFFGVFFELYNKDSEN